MRMPAYTWERLIYPLGPDTIKERIYMYYTHSSNNMFKRTIIAVDSSKNFTLIRALSFQ